MNHYLIHDTPVGELVLEANLNYLTKISFKDKAYDHTKSSSINRKNLILEKTIEQLDEYFFNNRRFFTINYLLDTTSFFKKVLKEVSLIKFGKVKSYKQIAKILKNKNAHRAADKEYFFATHVSDGDGSGDDVVMLLLTDKELERAAKRAEKNKEDLTRCAEGILLAREAHFPATIADLYYPEKMPADLRAAHDRNDEVLERIYIGRRFKNDTERLEKLFELYTKMTQAKGAA